MSGPAFFRGAYRLSAYQGVMAVRAAEAAGRSGGEDHAPSPAPQHIAPPPQVSAAPSRRAVDSHGREIVPATREAMQSHPELAGVFSFG